MRVAIAEDSGFFRSALAASLQSAGAEVIAAVDNAAALSERIESDTPDAIIVDICLPPTKTDEGLVAAEKLGARFPTMGVLVLSAYLAMPHVARLLNSGRSYVGCLSKDQLHDVDFLMDTLNRITTGGIVIDPEFVAHRFQVEALQKALTQRELELLRAVAEGRSNQGIATEFHIGIKTVEATLTSIFRKLGIDSRDGNARVQAVLTYLSRPQNFIKLHGGS